MTDFETGTEPDVLFYFNGNDSDAIVSAGKVVSLDEIRAAYPEFATNMKDDMLVPSAVDGKVYSVPVNGYWESMYVNTKVLEAAGVSGCFFIYSGRSHPNLVLLIFPFSRSENRSASAGA